MQTLICFFCKFPGNVDAVNWDQTLRTLSIPCTATGKLAAVGVQNLDMIALISHRLRDKYKPGITDSIPGLFNKNTLLSSPPGKC